MNQSCPFLEKVKFRNLTKSLIVIILQLSIAKIIFAQSNIYKVGRIIDSLSMQPVPFATIRLKTNQIGVYANAGGEFKILSLGQFRGDSLIVTSIGYKSKSIRFNFLDDSKINDIFLSPDIYSISEVKVTARKNLPHSLTIISRAIQNIKRNYPSDPFSYIGYFREYQKINGDYFNLREAIVQTLDKGFKSSSSENRYRLLDYKENSEFPGIRMSRFYDTASTHGVNADFKTIPEAVIPDLSGNELFVLRAHDAIRNYNYNTYSFIDTLSINFVRNHTFSKVSIVYEGSMLLYKINFIIRPGIVKKTLLFDGSIFIRPEDYSIHKLIYNGYYLNPQGTKKEMFNILSEYGYNEVADSLMYLKYVSFRNLFLIPDSSDSEYFQITNSYRQSGTPEKMIMVVEFNNKIDPVSARRGENYSISVMDRKIRIRSLKPVENKLFIEIRNEDLPGLADSVKIDIHNLKDISGNILGNKRPLEIYQFRELFVLENNKELNFKKRCYMDYVPLDQNCISQTDSVVNYWMNTPERIK
jgi:hypothetical protein